MIKRWLLRKIDKYPVISFDIFDTLVERTVSKPIEVFGIVEKELNIIPDFQQVRIVAEKKAREKAENGEVTLQTIYNEIEWEDDEAINKYMECELTVEQEVCKPKLSMLEIYNKVIASGKRVFLISDMYLSSEIIGNILKKCNIEGYEKLYISNEYGVNKISGKLFDRVIKENDLRLISMLHVGDSYSADYKGAKSQGLKSVLVYRKGMIKNKLYSYFKR